ncbi:MAG: PocR ligand-binding domain-containing protein [Planctomycetota bacterium]
MAKRTQITRFLGKAEFERIESTFREHFQLGLETTNTSGKEFKSLCGGDYQPPFCGLVRGCSAGDQRCIQERRRSLQNAIETGQSYITLCHAGIVFVCVPVMG